MATPVSDRSGEWQQQALCGWRDKHDVETADDACRTGKAMLGALMERKAQRGTNRACSGMVATEHCQAQDKGFGAARNSLAALDLQR